MKRAALVLGSAAASLIAACTSLEGLTDVPNASDALEGGVEASPMDASQAETSQVEASQAESSLMDDSAPEDGPGDSAQHSDADRADTGTTSMNETGPPEVALTVDFNAIGAGESGAVITSIPAGITCSATSGKCSTSASFPLNSSVRLTVSGAGASSVSAWLPSSCTGSECTVTMSSSLTVTYWVSGNNIVFSTAPLYTGNLGGLSGATAICADEASSAGLPGHYVPWLATTTVNATTALGSARGWIRPDGLPFADTIGTSGGTTGFIHGQLYYPPDLNAVGSNAIPESAWTGSNPDGSVYESSVTCGDWTSASGTATGNDGLTYDDSTGFVSNDSPVACSSPLAIYCFGTDLANPVTISPQPGRVAFTSKGTITGSAGLAAADSLCQSEASAASLANAASFVALMATSSASAASRLSASGQNWVRPDGLPLAASAASLLAGQILLTPSLHADGSLVAAGTTTWSGATAIGMAGTSASTCDDWTSGSSSLGVACSQVQEVVSDWFGGVGGICGQDLEVYCFEE
jgi:hypothetical protein